MTRHPFVTVYKADDGRWKATWGKPGDPGRSVVFVFKKHGILTSAGRESWAMKKDAELRMKPRTKRIERIRVL